jgi:archaellum component FlaC
MRVNKMSNSANDYNNDTKIAVLQNTNLYIHETLNRIEKRLDKIDDRFNNLENKIDSTLNLLNTKIDSNFNLLNNKIDSNLMLTNSAINANFNTLNGKMDSHFKWILGSIFLTVGLGALANLFTITAKIMHWVN